MALLDNDLWQTTMWEDLRGALYLELRNVSSDTLDEMIDWLSDSNRPGRFAHYPENPTYRIASFVVLVVTDQHVFFELKLRWG